MIKGIGTDIVAHSRINLKIASKILSKKEFEIFDGLNEDLKIEFLASRFAAKEAIIKATDKQYNLSKIEIFSYESGKPYSNIEGISISISHEKEYSIAFAIWEE